MRTILTFYVILFCNNLYALDSDTMNAHYINVGQADAALLEFSCGAVLIDAGSQDDDHTDNLLTYLDSFFSKRGDLNNTLDAIMITHNHIDHTRALKEVAKRFTVKNYIGTGYNHGIGTGDPNWIRKNADSRSIKIKIPTNKEAREEDGVFGVTGPIIDSVNCVGTNPLITILAAPLNDNPGWSHKEFDNKNNHSLVIRIDFGEASFLFTGDLEEDAIEHMISFYGEEEGSPLDVDVYQVGHHGSHNGTTSDLLEAMSPEIAVFSVGQWDFGKETKKLFSTFSYGHPRKAVLDDLKLTIKKRRSNPITIKVGEKAKVFEDYKVSKKIYATAWDGNITIKAKEEGTFRVTKSQ